MSPQQPSTPFPESTFISISLPMNGSNVPPVFNAHGIVSPQDATVHGQIFDINQNPVSNVQTTQAAGPLWQFEPFVKMNGQPLDSHTTYSLKVWLSGGSPNATSTFNTL